MLKAVVASLDDVEEALKPFYSEAGDQFVLQVSGADSLPDVANLKNAYEAEKVKRAKANETIRGLETKASQLPEDWDLDVWENAKSGKVDEAAIAAAKAQAQKDNVQLRKALEGERDEWKAKHDALVTKDRQKSATISLTDALTKAGIKDDTFLEASRAMLAPKVMFDDEGAPFVQSDMGPMQIGDFVSRWAKDAGSAFVAKPSGGGSSGSQSTNPAPTGAHAKLVQAVPALANLPER